MSNLVRGLEFGTPKFYIAPYGKIKHELVNMSYNCDVKLGGSVYHILVFWFFNSELQIRSDIEDNSKIIFLISQ